MGSFTGKNAVIVGSATGIGKGLVDRSVTEGMSVALIDVDAGAIAARAGELNARGVNAFSVAADVTNRSEVGAAAATCFDRFGAVDLLCLNAGIQRQGRFLDVPLDDHLKMIDTNLVGFTIALKTFLGPMVDSGKPGRIVATASSCAVITPMHLASYNASKAGVLSLMETVHHELEAIGSPIRLSVLLPGAVNTSLHDWGRYGPDASVDGPTGATIAEHQSKLRHVLETRGMDPADVANVVFAGIGADRFWLLPHAEITQMARQRIDRLVAGENPTLTHKP
jgi:NAD(P)-dependent dehydrogenase (short-subunit alcohol dehydrogenase family)